MPILIIEIQKMINSYREKRKDKYNDIFSKIRIKQV